MMNGIPQISKLLLSIGIILVLSGGAYWLFADKLSWLGKLPLDFSWQKDNVKVYFPLGTMVLISVVGTILLNIILKIFRG